MQGMAFEIIQSRDLWTREQKGKADGLIKERNLKVFSIPTSQLYLIGNDAETSAVFEYPGLPMLKDLRIGTKCGIEALSKVEPMPCPVKWDLHILGSRKDDTHWSVGNLIKTDMWTANGQTFYCPLFDWTREQVIEASVQLGLDVSESDEIDTNGLNMCFNCVTNCGYTFCPKENKEIECVDWDRQGMLDSFRAKYCLN